MINVDIARKIIYNNRQILMYMGGIMGYSISHESGISDYYCCLRYKSVNFSSHVHSHIEFVFVLSGSLDICIENKSYSLTCGNVSVIMPYEIHSYYTTKESDVFIIACPPEYISEYRQILQGKIFETPVSAFTDSHKSLIEEISSDLDDGFRKKALVYCTLAEFLKKSPLKEGSLYEYDTYRKAIGYISENYTENITLGQVAFYIGVTTSHLSRVLNSDGKPGFSEILNSVRVYDAKQKLEQTNSPISEIAYETGFGSIRNFNRIFKKYFGCNPCDIRKTT